MSNNKGIYRILSQNQLKILVQNPIAYHWMKMMSDTLEYYVERGFARQMEVARGRNSRNENFLVKH